MEEDYHEYKLENGLHVVLQKTHTKTVEARLIIYFGSIHEKVGEEGFAHLLEHTLVTGGSKKYSPEKCDEIFTIFGRADACTQLDQTFFPADFLSEDTELFLDLVSEITLNPRFDKSKFEGEKLRVLREIADEESDNSYYDNLEYEEAFYGKNSVHKENKILGKEKVIKNASIKDIMCFHKKGYSPNNMSLIMVGALPVNVEKLIDKYFGNFQRGNIENIEIPKTPKLSKKIILRRTAKELYNSSNPEESSAELKIIFPAPTETEEESLTIRILNEILGGKYNTNSRLYQSISQQKGLAYFIKSSYDGDQNRGIIEIESKIPSKKSEQVLDAIFEEIINLRTSLVLESDLENIKKKIKYQILKLHENNGGHVQRIEKKIENGIDIDSYILKMIDIDPEEVRRIAIKYFPEDRNGNYVLLLRDPLN